MKQNFQQINTDQSQCSATAVAYANIALIKYWGKRANGLNLPAVGSISLTLDALKTETTVTFDDTLKADCFELNGSTESGRPLMRITNFLDCVAGSDQRSNASVSSNNNFPTGAGLASSASGFAALALASSKALGLKLSREELSKLARQGSGSAARSIFGGFVEMKCGDTQTGDEDYAISLFDENYWNIRMLIAVTSTQKKSVGSTEGMNRTKKTSPYYQSWIQSHSYDLNEMRIAIKEKRFEKMGKLAEHSCFKMHGLAMSAYPALIYWNAATVETIHAVRALRREGLAAYITTDAGPQVKILCLPEVVNIVKEALETIKGIKQIITCRPGPAASIKSLEKA